MTLARWAAAAVLACSISGAAWAQDHQIRVLGWYPNQPQTEDVEKPFYQTLSERTGIDISATYMNLAELNLRPFEHLRLLEGNAFDVITMGAGFISGDDPIFIGHDLPGLTFDFDEVRQVIDAWVPVLEEHLDEKYNAKLLTMAPFPPQILFCKGNVTGVADLRAKRIRVASAASSDFTEAMGGIAVTLAGPEVYQALQRGVIDCGATGTGYGNSNSWFEVTDVLYDVPLGGYSIVMHVARNEFWNALGAEEQEALSSAFAEMDGELWTLAETVHTDALRCNIGEEPCDYGRSGNMTLLTPGEEDRDNFRAILREAVLPNWMSSCDEVIPDCSARWAETVGQVTGIQQ